MGPPHLGRDVDAELYVLFSMYHERAASMACRFRCLEDYTAERVINGESTVREGYPAPQGEWFRDRLRVLAARYHELHGRHFHSRRRAHVLRRREAE
jgi:hypothetical protein